MFSQHPKITPPQLLQETDTWSGSGAPSSSRGPGAAQVCLTLTPTLQAVTSWFREDDSCVAEERSASRLGLRSVGFI